MEKHIDEKSLFMAWLARAGVPFRHDSKYGNSVTVAGVSFEFDALNRLVLAKVYASC